MKRFYVNAYWKKRQTFAARYDFEATQDVFNLICQTKTTSLSAIPNKRKYWTHLEHNVLHVHPMLKTVRGL